MDKKKILELINHDVYYVKTDVINYYITIPKYYQDTNICIEIKNKIDNYNLELNDEIWVMENIKNTYSYVDDYNITLIVPVFSDENISALEKMDANKYLDVDKIIGYVINNSYAFLRECSKNVANQIILVNNDRYKTFMNWFCTRYGARVVCKNLLELIQIFNANATSYKKLETPVMTFVVGSYNTEVDAPKAIPKENTQDVSNKKMQVQYSSGFSSYWLLAVVTIVVSLVVAMAAFMSK